MNGRERAIDLMDEMLSLGQSPETLLKYVVCNYLSGSEAFNAMQCAMEEYFGDEEDEVDENQVLEIGMEVEVVDEQCNECVLEYQDIGTITEISGENDIQYFRVVVDGRPDAGNWMRAAQLARINY